MIEALLSTGSASGPVEGDRSDKDAGPNFAAFLEEAEVPPESAEGASRRRQGAEPSEVQAETADEVAEMPPGEEAAAEEVAVQEAAQVPEQEKRPPPGGEALAALVPLPAAELVAVSGRSAGEAVSGRSAGEAVSGRSAGEAVSGRSAGEAVSGAGLPEPEGEAVQRKTLFAAAAVSTEGAGSERAEPGTAAAFTVGLEGRAPAPSAGAQGAQEAPDPAQSLVALHLRPREFDSLKLLNSGEMMLPHLRVEHLPGPVLERLQQALSGGGAPAFAGEAAGEVMPQVVRGMVTLVREGLAEMRLQLQPADLGQIELRVKTTKGVVRGELMVQHSEVKHLLEIQVERLRSALAQQGLELEGFDVGLAHDGQQPGESWTEQRGGAPGRIAVSGAEREEGRQAPADPLHSGQHEVNYLA